MGVGWGCLYCQKARLLGFCFSFGTYYAVPAVFCGYSAIILFSIAYYLLFSINTWSLTIYLIIFVISHAPCIICRYLSFILYHLLLSHHLRKHHARSNHLDKNQTLSFVVEDPVKHWLLND